MPKIRCGCGARFSFTEKSLGKKGKCARCGEILTLQPDNEDSGIISIAEEPEDGGVAPDDYGQPAFDTDAAPVTPPSFAKKVIIDAPENDQPPVDFAPKLLDTVLFIKEPHNFVVYLMLTGFLCLVQLALSFGILWGPIAAFPVFGWYCAFRFGVIANTATGDDKIPSVASVDNAMEALLLPAIRWFGSWFVVFLPMVIAGFAIAGTELLRLRLPNTPNVRLLDVLNAELLRLQNDFVPGVGFFGIISTFRNGGHGVIAAAILLGLFLWPIVALCVAFGGFTSLVRLDLIIKTVVATFPSYLLTVVVVYGSGALAFALASFLPKTAGGIVATVAASVYLEIVAMRAIGLHYYFFKGRYAWSWG